MFHSACNVATRDESRWRPRGRKVMKASHSFPRRYKNGKVCIVSRGMAFSPPLKEKNGEKWKHLRIEQTPREPGCLAVDISKYLLSASGLSLYLALSTHPCLICVLSTNFSLPFAFNHASILPGDLLYSHLDRFRVS